MAPVASRPARAFPPVVVAVLAAGSAVFLIVPDIDVTIGVAGMVVGQMTAAILFLVRAPQVPATEGHAWRMLALALIAGAAGVVLVGVLTSFGLSLPAYGPIDLVFLGGYVALTLGLMMLSRVASEGPGWKLTLLDTLVGAVSLAVFAWLVVGHGLVDNFATADAWSRLIAPLYPIVDVAVVLAVINLTVRRTARRFDAGLIVLAIGLATQVVADIAYLIEGMGRTFTEAEPRFELYLAASACYVASGAMIGRRRHTKEYPERATLPLWALAWPYALASGLFATHVMLLTRLDLPTDLVVTLVASLLVGAFVITRQIMAIREARSMVDRQRRELVSSVSHELRTPLTAMVGYLELLSDRPEAFSGRERDEMMTTITDQARHLARVVTDMIALARDGGRGLAVEPRPTTLGDVCRQSLKMMDGSFVTLAIDGDASVTIDGDRIAQALLNLLTNARRYGRGACILMAGRTGNDAVFEVHDDGPGVPVRHQVTIWDQFERGVHRLDATTPGVGVGLAITKAIVRSHGGTVSYRRSERLGGACFSLTIPSTTSPRPRTATPVRLAV